MCCHRARFGQSLLTLSGSSASIVVFCPTGWIRSGSELIAQSPGENCGVSMRNWVQRAMFRLNQKPYVLASLAMLWGLLRPRCSGSCAIRAWSSAGSAPLPVAGADGRKEEGAGGVAAPRADHRRVRVVGVIANDLAWLWRTSAQVYQGQG